MKRTLGPIFVLFLMAGLIFGSPLKAQTPFSEDATVEVQPTQTATSNEGNLTVPNGASPTPASSGLEIDTRKVVKKVIENVTCIEDIDKPLTPEAVKVAAGGFAGKTVGSFIAVTLVTSIIGPIGPIARLIVGSLGGEVGKKYGKQIASEGISLPESLPAESSNPAENMIRNSP